MKKKLNLQGVCIPIILIYLSVSNGLYLLPRRLFNFGLGNLYDLLFLWYFIKYLKKFNYSLKLVTQKEILRFYLIWIGYVIIEGILALTDQSVFESIRSIKEMFLFLAVFFLLDFKFDGKKTLKVLTYFEILGCVVYIIQSATGIKLMQAALGKQNIFGTMVTRSYAEIPVFGMFIISFLLIGIIEKKPLYSYKKDIIFLIITTIAEFVRYARSVWIAMIIVFTVSIIFAKTKGNLFKKICFLLAIVIILFYIMPKYFPAFVSQFNNTFDQLEMGAGTGALRTNAFRDRWNYLSEHNKLLFGLGAMGPNYVIPGFSGYGSIIKIVDIAYAGILIKYGIVGLVFYFILWILIALKSLKMSLYGKALSVYIISELWLSTAGNMILEDGLLVLAILFSITIKIYEQERDDIKKSKAVIL